MPLTLILGPANSAKAGEVLGAYSAAARRGAVLVVPTVPDARLFERELAEAGAVLGGSVVTFDGLAREIAWRTGYRGRRLSALQRERVLSRAVAGASLTALSRSAEAAGFPGAAGALIAELQRSLVTPQRFAQAMSALGGPDAHDLGALYLAYSRELERLGRVDADLYAWRALDALRSEPGRWGGDAAFFYGFDDLHPLQRDAVETLSRVVGAEVTVSLTYEPGRDAFSARAETVAELTPLAARVVELPALDQYYVAESRAALHLLERQLFEDAGSDAADRPDPGLAVRLLEAGGERAEVELIAAEVLALLRAGVAADEIVICHRAPGTVASLFERVFADFGIAVSAERTLRFAHTALGGALTALARCALLESASAEDLLRYLRAPGVLERPEVADRLEASLRRDGRTRFVDARERLDWELHEIDAIKRDPIGGLVAQARRLLAAPNKGAAALLGDSETLDLRALTVLVRAFDELDELGDRLGGAELIELLAELPVRAGLTARPGAVLLSEPLAIRARRFRAVFVCGLQEGAFPRPSSPDAFLPDERRRELAAASGLVLGRREDAIALERYLFYACVSRATEQVVLSYRSSDEEGNLALPSPFIGDVAELFDAGWPERRRTRLLADVVWGFGEAPTARERTRAHAALGAPVSGEPELPSYTLSGLALRRVRHSEVVSAGALESYAACPVRWLVERELQPDRFEPEPEAMARGNYMHGLLEQLLSRLGGPITRASLPDALALLDELVAEGPAAVAVGRPPAVRAAALESIVADLRRYLEHEAATGSGWRQAGLELRFGFEDRGSASDTASGGRASESLPALALAEDVAMRGVIDRVDIDGAGHAIVRDYKSGRVRPEYPSARWSEDRQLQVPLYMLATRRLLELEPVAGFYQPLGGEKLSGRGAFTSGVDVGTGVGDRDARSAEELEQLLDQAAVSATEIARRLRSGDLTPCPETCTRNGCAFPGICRAV